MRERIRLDDADRRELLRMSRRRKGPRQLALRARIVLASTDGSSDREVGRQLGVHHQTVAKWRRRFMTAGLAGLTDRDRHGRPQSVSPASVERLLKITVSSAPEAGGPWYADLLAQRMGWSPSTIKNLWQACGLRPRDVLCTDLKDGLLVNGEWDVVGFYRGRDGRAVVVAVVGASTWGEEAVVVTGYRQEENGGAVDVPGTSATAGITVDPSNGLRDFAVFLNDVEAAVPDDWGLQLIVDNSAMHTAALMRHVETGRPPRFRVFSTPSAAAWDDLVDRLVGVMEERWWTCGVHQRGDHLVDALYRRVPEALIRPDIWQPGQDESACLCEEHRARLMVPRYMSDWGKGRDASRTRRAHCERVDLRQCRDCCERQYHDVRRRVTARWHDAFGAGRVVQMTLTYRPGFTLGPDGWLRRARRDFQKLRERWNQDWGQMPPHLMSLEWTRLGLPHFHILVPWEEDPYFLATLREWAWKSWVSIIGGVPDRRTRYRHAVNTTTYPIAAPRIAYILKTVGYPQWQVAPYATPHFHRWYGSYQRRPWPDAQRPRCLLEPR